MGQVSNQRILALISLLILLMVVQWQLNRRSSESAGGKSINLREMLTNIDGWRSGPFIELDPMIVNELKLDDYINQSYLKLSSQVHLYVGYYNSAEKIGAAHDPLVCFPGQGWVVSDRTSNRIKINGDVSISYSSMIVERYDTKSLILYWFQAHEKTSSNTLNQKIDLILSKIAGKGEENAFVRISSNMGDSTIDDVRQKQLEFIRSFYPLFSRYINGQNIKS